MNRRVPRESGIGLPHSTTLARILACHSFREVVEFGSSMPLSPNSLSALLHYVEPLPAAESAPD